MLRSIGAEQVIDFTQAISPSMVRPMTSFLTWQAGVRFPIRLNPEEKWILSIGESRDFQMVRGALISMFGSKKVLFGSASHKVEDLNFLKELMEAGVIKTVIDRTLPIGADCRSPPLC